MPDGTMPISLQDKQKMIAELFPNMNQDSRDRKTQSKEIKSLEDAVERSTAKLFFGSPELLPKSDNVIDKLPRDEWIPHFAWTDSLEDASDRINLPHEDYPDRVDRTTDALKKFTENYFSNLDNPPHTWILNQIHSLVFDDEPFRGRFRDCQVYIGRHVPPPHYRLPDLMNELESITGRLDSVKKLYEWYFRFETIHPYQDGNGRVGGIVVASISNALSDGKQWIAPAKYGDTYGSLEFMLT